MNDTFSVKTTYTDDTNTAGHYGRSIDETWDLLGSIDLNNLDKLEVTKETPEVLAADPLYNQAVKVIQDSLDEVKTKSKIPSALHANNIGKIVTIQVFRRNDEEEGMIHGESLEKHVGKLEGFWFDKTTVGIRLRGMTNIITSRKKHHVEVYI